VVVLAYHRVGPPPVGSWETWFSVPEDRFLEQLHSLVDAGWEPVGVRTFLAGLDEPGELPARSALITFDDGFKSLTGAAANTLVRLGFPGVVFVPVAHVGGTNAWDADSSQPSEPLCTWDELRALERAGVSVESHAFSHRDFSSLDREALARELEDSKATIERELGKRVELVAYPYGDAGPATEDVGVLAARAGYQAGFLYGGGPFEVPVGDRFRLPRIAVGPDTDLRAELARAS